MSSGGRDADIIVVGSGHNGLVTAAYAAKAGYKVVVLEKREDIGGAVCTRDMFGGYKMDIGGSLHCMIHHTPIVADLQLGRYGLEYIEVDPILTAPLSEGRQLYIFRSLERTCESMARISERDAQGYYDFVRRWLPINRAIFDFFLQTPTVGNMLRTVLLPSHGMGMRERMAVWSGQLLSYGELIRRTFTHPEIRGVMAWWAAQSGPPPHRRQSAELFAWQAMLHVIGAFRPKGGSGALTAALRDCIIDHGGEVVSDAEVETICVAGGGRGNSRGGENGRDGGNGRGGGRGAGHTRGMGDRVCGVRTRRGEWLSAPCVVANAHVKIVFEQLLRDWTPPGLRRRIAALNIGNGFGMIVRCAMNALPQYHPDAAVNRQLTTGVQLLCASMSHVERAYRDYERGEPAREPAALAMTFSAIDGTLAPPGKHVMFVWGQYHPYTLRNGERWADIAQREADKLIAVVDRAAPGTREALRDCYIQTPASISELHSMPCGNIMHLEMEPRSMFMRRPLRGLHTYSTPLRGLFLASAGTHPGGGIFGAAGYNCYRELRPFLERAGA